MADRNIAPTRKNVKCGGTNTCLSIARVYEPRIWETRFGCWVAMSLTVLEVKRLLLLTLEMLLNSHTIRFAGALVPVIFTFVDAGLSFPVTLTAVYAIRKCKMQPCQPRTKRDLRRAVLSLMICALLNVVSIALIALYVNGNIRIVEKMFKASMKIYARNLHSKVTIDELQLDLQCCGYSSYFDWFAVNWQAYDDIAINTEDEEAANEQSVPFSCCNRHAMVPCIHMEMRLSDEKSINGRGCADIITRILFKIAIVGYIMTALIISTQITVITFFIRVIKRVLPNICSTECYCWESTSPLSAAIINCSSDDSTSYDSGKDVCKKRLQGGGAESIVHPHEIHTRRLRFARKICSSTSLSSSEKDSVTSSCERLTSSPSFAEYADKKCVDSASIDPSSQRQHRLPKKNRN